MRKVVAILVLMLFVLTACGSGSDVSGRRVAVPSTTEKATGAVVAPTDAEPTVLAEEPVDAPVETGKSAAEALAEVKEGGEIQPPSGKSGQTLYPPVDTAKQGKDALLERTRAAFTTGSAPKVEGDTDTETGSRYYDSSGNPTNLPEDYGQNQDWND